VYTKHRVRLQQPVRACRPCALTRRFPVHDPNSCERNGMRAGGRHAHKIFAYFAYFVVPKSGLLRLKSLTLKRLSCLVTSLLPVCYDLSRCLSTMLRMLRVSRPHLSSIVQSPLSFVRDGHLSSLASFASLWSSAHQKQATRCCARRIIRISIWRCLRMRSNRSTRRENQ